jgi:transcriptional regulator with XRE-family HTH domain
MQRTSTMTRAANNGHRNTPMKTPGERLKDLLRRASLTQSAVSELMKYGSRASMNRYVNGSRKDLPIEEDVVRKLVPILKGRGVPPISEQDVLNLALRVPVNEPVFMSDLGGDEAAQVQALQVRYRIEPGVLYKSGVKRTLGNAPICAVPDFPARSQWAAVVVADDGKRGEVLHCVDPEQFPSLSLGGRRVVYSVHGADATIVEPVVGVGKISQHELLVELPGGGKLGKGTVLGVVIGSYKRE